MQLYYFSNDKSHKNDDVLNIKLLDGVINKSESPLFLGIRFDKHLTFKNQLNYLKEPCMKRLNVLKILSKKNWGLSLTQVYNSLICSLFEYSSVVYPCCPQQVYLS
jgi:hypothetical protein